MRLKECAEEVVDDSFERWMMRRSASRSCEERFLIPSWIQAFYLDAHCRDGYFGIISEQGMPLRVAYYLGYALMWSFCAREPIA